MIKNILLIIACCFFTVNLDAQNWTQLTDCQFGRRSDLISFSHNGKGYAGFGLDLNYVAKSDFWEYDPISDTWIQKASGPPARYGSISIVIGNKAYVGFGSTNVNTIPLLNDWWEYDFALDTWTQKNNFPGASRYTCMGFAIGNYGYMGCGYTPTLVNDFWKYNPFNDSWTQLTPFIGVPRQSGTAFSANGKGYMGLGYSSSTLNDWWEYNPTLNSWTQKNNYPAGHRYASQGFAVNDYGYILGGRDISNTYDEFYQYNSLNDTWLSLPNFGGGNRSGNIGFGIADTLYSGAGNINPSHQKSKDFWKLVTPNTIQGIEKPSDNKTDLITIFPNPSSGDFYIHSEESNISEIEIFNILGESITLNYPTLHPINGLLNIKLTNYPNGIYILKIKQLDKILAKKLIIQIE